MDANHGQICHQSRLYELAFSFRDIAAECDTPAAPVPPVPPVPFDNAKAAWRRVPVLRRLEPSR